MKKWISMILSAVLMAGKLCIPASASETSDAHIEDVKLVAQRYMSVESLNETVFSQKNCYSYWTGVEAKENNTALSDAIEIATEMRGVTPDKYLYAEILMNLMQMQSGDLAEQIQYQTQFDDTTDLAEYTETIIDSTVGLFAGDSVWSPVWDAVSGGKDVLIQNEEQAKYYKACISDYGQSRSFLDAIIENTDNRDLKAAAKTLLQAQEELLNLRLEYLADSAEISANYEAEFFRENLSYALLKETDMYLTDDTVKWFVDGAEVFTDTVTSGAEFVYDMGTVVANLAFGCDDTFKRHQEMKILVDIAEAIIGANDKVDVSVETFIEKSITDFDDESLNTIKRKCEYYKMLLAVHARGEYLNYLEFANNESLLSQVLVLQDCFKAPEDSFMGGYQEWSNKLAEYSNMVDLAISTIEENMSQLEEIADFPNTETESLIAEAEGEFKENTVVRDEPVHLREYLSQDEIDYFMSAGEECRIRNEDGSYTSITGSWKNELMEDGSYKKIFKRGESSYRVNHEDGSYSVYVNSVRYFPDYRFAGLDAVETLYDMYGKQLHVIRKEYNYEGILDHRAEFDELGRRIEETNYYDENYVHSVWFSYDGKTVNVSMLLEVEAYGSLSLEASFDMSSECTDIHTTCGYKAEKIGDVVTKFEWSGCSVYEYDKNKKIIRTVDLLAIDSQT